MERYVSAKVLLNSDLSMKAQRVYAIPMPTVISCWVVAQDLEGNPVRVGVLVQDWRTADCLDRHPDYLQLARTLEKHFGLKVMSVEHA